jgi:hypothetical protein
LLCRVFSARGLDALENGKAQQYDRAYCDPMWGNMQDYGSIDQPANQYQEADNVDSE